MISHADLHADPHEDLVDTLAAEVSALCPDFVPEGAPLRTLKSVLLAGRSGGAPVIAKRLLGPDAPWRWYFEREVLLYQRFASAPPPVRAPRLVAADPEGGLVVLERLPGAPLGPARRARGAVSPAVLSALLEARASLAAWGHGLALAPDEPPPARERAEIRDRLLEDPTAPLGWYRDGIERCRALGILSDSLAANMRDAVERCPLLVFSHGDLLPRNVLCDGDAVALIDWECAGPHPEGWDLALLWLALPEALRAPVERAAGHDQDRSRYAAFLAGAAFAVARELKFQRFSFRRARETPAVVALERELASVEARLAAALAP